MSRPKISIAMPTYNGERFLREQLDSFARQERLPDELVVSDDASTDRTVDIVREFAAEAPFPVRIFVNEKRLGINGNFGRAIEESAGDIIFLSDSDDTWYPQKIRLMGRTLEEMPQAGIAICNSDQADEQLRPLGTTTWASVDRFFPSQRLLSGLAKGKTYWSRMPAQGCCLAFRGKLKELILPLPESVRYKWFSYDRFIAQVIFCSGAGGAALLPEPLQAYRRHSGQASHLPPRPPLFRRLIRRARYRLARRHDGPYRLPFLLQRIESESAARLCINPAMRRAAICHWRARVNMPASFAGRLPVVLRELISLRYHRLSGDTFSAAKDLLFSRRTEDETMPRTDHRKTQTTCHSEEQKVVRNLVSPVITGRPPVNKEGNTVDT